MAIRVKFLKPREIGNAADELLYKYVEQTGTKLSAPIPVDNIVEIHLGLTLEIKNLCEFFKEPDILGATWIDEKLVRIDKSIERTNGRFEFTLAHEVGHWVLHRPLLIVEREMPELFTNSKIKPPNYICRSSQKKEPIEKQADMFAAMLLMPEKLMQQSFSDLYPDGLKMPVEIIKSRNKEKKTPWLKGVAANMIENGGFSNCSNHAMRIRIEKLNLVDISLTNSLF